MIAQRVVVIGEERRILADGTPQRILGDRDLLIQANPSAKHTFLPNSASSMRHLPAKPITILFVEFVELSPI